MTTNESATMTTETTETSSVVTAGFSFLKYNHIEFALDQIRVIFNALAADIDRLTPGHEADERIRLITWAENYVRANKSLLSKTLDETDDKDVEKKIRSAATQLYNTLGFLVSGYPGVEIRRGRHGGIYRVA